MSSRFFGSEIPNKPHLVRDGKGGVAGEVGDLRSDAEAAFQRIQTEIDTTPGISAYISTSAATSVGVANTFQKADGTTTVINAVDFTQVGNNSWRYDGTIPKWFKLDSTFSVGTIVSMTVTLGVAHGTAPLSDSDVTEASKQDRLVGAAADVGNMGLQDIFLLQPDDVVEVWLTSTLTQDVELERGFIEIKPASTSP